jgi:trans-aconitate methyltransferase
MTLSSPRMYSDLAEWWPLLSPPSHYIEEAADLLPRIKLTPDSRPATLLELGCGGGSLAFHLKRHFQLTLTDVAPAMLAVSQAVNPDCEHLPGDMRSLRLARQFDVVLIHDAIMYSTTAADVEAALRTAAIHCRPGGTVAVLPDYVRETFTPGTDEGVRTHRTAGGFAISNGGGIPTPPTTCMWWTTPFCCAPRMGP